MKNIINLKFIFLKIEILILVATISANCQIAIGDTIYVKDKSGLAFLGVNLPKTLKLKIVKIDSLSIEGKLINEKKGYRLVSKNGGEFVFGGNIVFYYSLNDIIYSKRFRGNPKDLKFTWVYKNY